MAIGRLVGLATALIAAGNLAGCAGTGPVAGAESQGSTQAQMAGLTAEPLSAPEWRIGDRWRYSDGYSLEVDKIADGETRFRRLDAPDQWFSRRGFLRQDAKSATAERSVVFRSIATGDAARLLVGQPIVFTREFVSNGVTRVHSTSWVVEGRERISVPAGDFDCTVIVMRTRNPETGWTGFERWWYAPAARHYVRLEYRYGEGPIASRVLTDYDAPPVQAAAYRNRPNISHSAPTAAISGQQNNAAPPSASHGPKGNSSAAADADPFARLVRWARIKMP